MYLAENSPSDTRLRFLLYCHDTYGLGHLRRALTLAAHFVNTWPNAEVLVVTGSPLAHAYELPPRVDYVKLPAATKTRSGDYHSRSLGLGFSSIRDLRATLLLETARAYRPNVFLVDHAPQGLKGEALPALQMLKFSQPDCLRVLGLRDIVDDGQAVQKAWTAEGIYQTLEQDYDLILVYGSQGLFDVAKEYGLPGQVKKRIRYCGFLNRVSDSSTATRPRPIPREARPLVAVTAGGGGDGFPLMRDYLMGLGALAEVPFSSVLLTGPLMEQAERDQLRALADRLPSDRLRLEQFMMDPLPLLRSADLVVAMAGYNTTCELLAMRQRMLLVPRIRPRQEQFIRAMLLARHGLAHLLSPNDMTPETLVAGVRRALVQPRPNPRRLAAAGISFDGQAAARGAIVEALQGRWGQWATIASAVGQVA